MSGVAPAALVHVRTQTPTRFVHLRGSATGQLQLLVPSEFITDVSTSISVAGTGVIRPMGASLSTVQALIGVGGFKPVTAPYASGHLTITNARGLITIKLESGTQGNASVLPRQMRYVIESGTGAFLNVRGQGAIRTSIGASSLDGSGLSQLTMTFRP